MHHLKLVKNGKVIAEKTMAFGGGNAKKLTDFFQEQVLFIGNQEVLTSSRAEDFLSQIADDNKANPLFDAAIYDLWENNPDNNKTIECSYDEFQGMVETRSPSLFLK